VGPEKEQQVLVRIEAFIIFPLIQKPHMFSAASISVVLETTRNTAIPVHDATPSNFVGIHGI
jgi:hypothetical protein